MNYMYAQYVKNTMQTLNIADVSTDRHFPWTVCTSAFSSRQLPLCLLPSFSAGFFSLALLPQGENPDLANEQIKSLLCTPIRNGKKDKVIGEGRLHL